MKGITLPLHVSARPPTALHQESLPWCSHSVPVLPLQIANHAQLEASTRQLAAEFLITLCEAREKAPGMMRKLPDFLGAFFDCLMGFLMDIEVMLDPAGWNCTCQLDRQHASRAPLSLLHASDHTPPGVPFVAWPLGARMSLQCCSSDRRGGVQSLQANTHEVPAHTAALAPAAWSACLVLHCAVGLLS